MSVRKIFSTGKKRDLSDDSKEQVKDDPKKEKVSSASSCIVNHGDVFSEGLDDSSCRDILYNCLKNLQTEVKDLASLAKDSQIKGEKKLGDMKKSVYILTQKFDCYEEDGKRKVKIIKYLRREVTSLYTKLACSNHGRQTRTILAK